MTSLTVLVSSMAGVVASGYGDAIFQLAKEENLLDVFSTQLLQMQDTVQSHQELALVLKHPKLPKEEKKKILANIFKDANKYLLHFIYLLIDKNRFAHFSDIVKVYMHKFYEERNIEIAYVQSAVPLSDQQVKEIKALLEKRCHKSVEMKTSVNPALLAGLRVKMKDEVLDNSAATRLAKMKDNVLKTTL